MRLPVGTYVAFSQSPNNVVFIVMSLLLEMADAISRFFIFVIVTWQMNLLMIVYTRFITETFVPVFIV